ncbi:Glutamyl-tRNA(Gln) amidotransferase subunit A (Partial), partial [Seminavis robusta]|eukprot:Sro1103_g241650.1 Glutamyl-tRNA(Gln) amidotransferase subunit A (226) ;mRNA; r:2-679
MTQDNNNDDSTIHVYSSALEMAAAIRTGTITSRELVEQHIARIERLDHWKINAVVLRDFDAARAQADKADEMVRNGESLLLGPFHGVPLTLKESIFTPNFKTTMGDPKFWVPPGAHSETARLMMEDGGAILMGKTNLCKNALDWESNNPIYGATSNPFDTTKSPGGSSGGAAAALAAGFTPLEVGTDLGGSVRIPAAMNGVVGHCATRGIVPAPNPVFRWPCCGGF